MPSQPPVHPAADVRTTRLVLVALVLLWAALALWVYEHADTLLGRDANASGTRDVASTSDASISGPASGAPPTATATPAPIDALAETRVPPAFEEPVRVSRRATEGAADVDVDVDVGANAGDDTPLAPVAVPPGRSRDTVAVPGPSTIVAARPSDGRASSLQWPELIDPDSIDPARGSSGIAPATSPDGPPSPAESFPEWPPSAIRDAAEATGRNAAVEIARETPYERRRRLEIAELSTLLGERLVFQPFRDELVVSSLDALNRAFEVLFLYPETRVSLIVESRETNDPDFDAQLSRLRGRAVVDYLVSRGIEPERLQAEGGDARGLPSGELRVRVVVEDENG